MTMLKEKQVADAIREAAAVALEALPNQVGHIHNEIEHKLLINETESTTYTVKIDCKLKINLGESDISPSGKLKWPRKDGEVSADGRTITIPDPNQPELTNTDGQPLAPPAFDNTAPVGPGEEHYDDDDGVKLGD